MESQASLPFLIAVTEPQSRSALPPEAVPVWMCYRMGNGLRLFRCGSGKNLSGGILSAHDGTMRQWGDPVRFCRQVVQECRARSAEGFLANWSRPPSEPMRRLTASLEQALAREGLSFYVPEQYAHCCDSASILVSSAVTDDVLCEKLQRLSFDHSSQRLILAYERLCTDFALPCSDGTGRLLSDQQFSSLKNRFSPTIHHSSQLCANYFTYELQERTHLVLFDDEATCHEKRSIARRYHLGGFLAFWQEIHDDK